MWEEIKSKKENAILCLEYNDFAFVEVEKIKKESINFLSVELEIYDIYHNSFMLYKMDEVSKLLNIFKTKVEELDRVIDDYSDDELDSFIDKLDDLLNDF